MQTTLGNRLTSPSLRRLGLIGIAVAVLATPLAAQFPGVTLPPGGDNQRQIVTQYMGFVSVTLDYNSPDVTSPQGQDRTGEIWGQLVPWGLSNAGFGNGNPMPWRGGANENTVFEVSHDVEIEGQPLPAGRYGLHLIPGEDEWVVIFSNNHRAWGSFFYEESEDALRVTVKAEEAPYREWLTYDFVDRQLDATTVALHWEKLRVPFRVSVPNLVDRYVSIVATELTGSPGFSWNNWNAAANFLLQRDTDGQHDELAVQWADAAVGAPFVGQENFTTLSTQAAVYAKVGRIDDADTILAKAIEHPTATPFQVHGVGRQLIAQGMNDKALEVFEKNFERFDGAWPTHVGMARGLSAVGRHSEAQKHAQKALDQAPSPPARQAVEGLIEQLTQSASD